ncbi:MAG: hypothetical protein ACR2MS_06030 [Weeksellaceae bacterium]
MSQTLASASKADKPRDKPDLFDELNGGPLWIHPADEEYYNELHYAVEMVLRHYIPEKDWSKHGL